MRALHLPLILGITLLLSACAIDSLNSREVLSAIKGKVERKIHDANHVEYILSPNHRCDFSMGDSSVLYRFMRSQNRNLEYKIEKIDDLHYKICIQNRECIESTISSDAENISLLFESQKDAVIDLMPNPFLIADVFVCESRDDSDKDVVIP